LILANDRTEFDILLTDIIMPLMGGPDLVKIVSSSHPDIKILFMSGYADVSVETQIANDKSEFIHKPITMLQLATKLRQVLAQRP
jgi:two-component system cell cycle sensor histidine kinase/response regulator CckA